MNSSAERSCKLCCPGDDSATHPMASTSRRANLLPATGGRGQGAWHSGLRSSQLPRRRMAASSIFFPQARNAALHSAFGFPDISASSSTFALSPGPSSVLDWTSRPRSPRHAGERRPIRAQCRAASSSPTASRRPATKRGSRNRLKPSWAVSWLKGKSPKPKEGSGVLEAAAGAPDGARADSPTGARVATGLGSDMPLLKLGAPAGTGAG